MVRQLSTVIAFTVIVSVSTHCRAGRGKTHVAPNGQFSVQVESGGTALPVYTHRGKSYVEGYFGAPYGIRISNHTGSRVEAVVTVDGRDVITGKVGDYRSGRGYVIDPYDSVLVDGFRTTWDNVAAFTFTDVGDSYAARMGDASNVGVIGVAVFKERAFRPRPAPIPDPLPRRHFRDQGLGTGYGGSAPSAPKSSARGGAAESEAFDSSEGYAATERRHRQGLGTQYGQDTYSPTTSTTFVRATRRPTALLAIRYDDREGLIALGVLPRPYQPPRPYYRRKPLPDPFPRSPEPVTFAPPPPRYDWE